MSDLPENWLSQPLGDISVSRRGLTYSSYQISNQDTGIAYINMKSFKKGGGYNFKGLKFFSGCYLKDDLVNESDLLIANTDVTLDGDIVGVPAYLPKELQDLKVLFSHHVTRIRLNGRVSSLYLNYLFNIYQYRRWMLKYARGTTVLMLDMHALKRIPIIYPPKKEEQQKIATILTSIDTAIEKTEALINKYQQIKAGLMHDLFTRGITADGKLRPPREQAPELYQETPIGWIPKEWTVEKLEKVLQISGGYLQTGPFGSQLHAHEYTAEGVPVVMPQDIDQGNISIRAIARITEKRAQMLIRHRLKIDDIIIARRGELSRAASISKYETGWVCGTGCFLLRLAGSKLNSRFFSHIYRYDMIQRQIAGLSVGTTMPSLNNSVMNTLYFPLLESKEQDGIVKRLDSIENQLELMLESKVKFEKQKQGLMQDLLTGKVRVNVN